MHHLPRIRNLISEMILALHDLCQIPCVSDQCVSEQQLGLDWDLVRKGILSRNEVDSRGELSDWQ